MFKRQRGLCKRLFEDQQLHGCVRHDEQQLRHRKTPVQRHQYCAEPRAGIEQDNIFRPVETEDRDAVAAADAELSLQRARRLFDPRMQHGVGQLFSFENDRGFVWRECRVPLNEVAKVHSN